MSGPLISRTVNTGGGAAASTLGSVDGFEVKYKDSTHIDITAGIFESDGLTTVLSANEEDVLVTSIPAGFDSIYFYLDKSASTSTSQVFYNDTDEPVFDPVRRGNYHPTNTEDRCFGDVFTPAAGATILPFSSASSRNKVRVQLSSRASGDLDLAVNLSPTGAYQSVTTESSAILPVYASEILVSLVNSEGAGLVTLSMSTQEYAAADSNIVNAQTLAQGPTLLEIADWLSLDASRNIKIRGKASNDNALSAYVYGYGYSR